MERLQDAGWRYSIGVRMQSHVRAAIGQSPSSGGRRSRLPEGRRGPIAETRL